jgi:hypothetical protein
MPNFNFLISKTGVKNPKNHKFFLFFFFIFQNKKSPSCENSLPTFMGSLQDFSTQTGLFICVSDIVLPKSINCKAPWNTNYSYDQIKCLQDHMPCREDHAHEEEEEKQTRFFSLTHELNVWMKHKFQGFLFECKTQKVTIMLESRQQATMAMHW